MTSGGNRSRRRAAKIPPVNRGKVKRAIKDKERDGEEQGKVALRQRRQVTRRAGHGMKGHGFDGRRGDGGPIFRGSVSSARKPSSKTWKWRKKRVSPRPLSDAASSYGIWKKR